MTRWQGASFRAGTSHLSELTLAEIVCENDPSICLDLLRSVLESNYQYPAVVVRLQDFSCAVKTFCEKTRNTCIGSQNYNLVSLFGTQRLWKQNAINNFQYYTQCKCISNHQGCLSYEVA